MIDLNKLAEKISSLNELSYINIYIHDNKTQLAAEDLLIKLLGSRQKYTVEHFEQADWISTEVHDSSIFNVHMCIFFKPSTEATE